MQRQIGKLLTAVGLLHVAYAGVREASMHKTTQYTRNSIVCGPAHKFYLKYACTWSLTRHSMMLMTFLSHEMQEWQ